MKRLIRLLTITFILLIFSGTGFILTRSQTNMGTLLSQRRPDGRLPNQQQPATANFVSSKPVTPTISPPITSLPLAQPEFTLDREINPRLSNIDNIDLTAQGVPGIDPLLAAQARSATAVSSFLTPTLNFDGQGFSFVNPPDTVGDVGPNHYIQMINGGGGALLTIYDKSGTLIAGPTSLDSFGSGACANGFGDPIVLYDQLADRWLLSEFAYISTGNHLCVYVSQTNDPVSTSWYAYDFTTPNFPDYPKYAVWPDAYYVSTNEGAPPVYALDRENMLAGNVARPYRRFTAPALNAFGFQALIPSDLDGATPPPANAPNYFMRHRDDEVHNPGANNPTQDYLEIWEFAADFDTPANATFQHTQDIPVAEFDSDLCGFAFVGCFAQPGTAVKLDPIRELLMWRLQYRNFNGIETLVGNFVVDVDGSDHGGIRWFELRKTASANWSLYQEGTLAPDADNRWMASAALDGSGNLTLGYSVVSSSQYPAIRYAGRLVTDTLGTLPYVEGSIREGSAANSSLRWGDYSALSVDPADDCTFWYTTLYNETSQWKTAVATFSFPECSGSLYQLYTYFPIVFNQ